MPGTHLASSARFFWRILEQRGHDAKALLALDGASPSVKRQQLA